MFLGYFNSEIDAALAYDRASIQFRGPERAKVNFPESRTMFAPLSSSQTQANYHQPPFTTAETAKRSKQTVEEKNNSSLIVLT